MRHSKHSEVPASLSRLSQRFLAWRKTRTRGKRIPASLWNSAVKMATKHGLDCTARSLKVDYDSLKKRIDAAEAKEPESPPFVELPASAMRVASECVIEWEDHAGARMRVHFKGPNVPDVLALSRSFWSAD